MVQSNIDQIAAYSKSALKDRVAIVTGSGSGIGQGIALGFANVGAKVVVAEKHAGRCEETAAQIRELGGEVLVVETNAEEPAQVKSMIEKTMAEFGRIDILVNNVGGARGTKPKPIEETSDENWDLIINANLRTNFLCTKAVIPTMMEQKNGAIINISSRAALGSSTLQPAYGAAKAGLLNLTESLAVQLAPYNIRVNAIAPGIIITAGSSRVGIFEESVVKSRGIPLGRAGRPYDIACAAIYLASDASAWVTGITLPVAGGPSFGRQMLESAKKGWEGSRDIHK